jgi:hypothetical protein
MTSTETFAQKSGDPKKTRQLIKKIALDGGMIFLNCLSAYLSDNLTLKLAEMKLFLNMFIRGPRQCSFDDRTLGLYEFP